MQQAMALRAPCAAPRAAPLQRPAPTACAAGPLSARCAGFAGARPLLCAAPRLATSRPRCVEVYADKGKRRGRSNGPSAAQQQPQVPMPPVDPDNAQFVIFVRSKRGLKRWFPLNVVTGGSQANLLVKGLESDLTKETSQSTLIREVARTIYKDREQIEALVRDKFPPMKFAKEIEYGMSILSKEKPRESVMGMLGVMALPDEADLGQTPVEAAAAGAAGILDSISSGWKSFVDSTKMA